LNQDNVYSRCHKYVPIEPRSRATSLVDFGIWSVLSFANLFLETQSQAPSDSFKFDAALHEERFPNDLNRLHSEAILSLREHLNWKIIMTNIID